MRSVRDPPSIPPQIELRPAKAVDRREILDLWDRRAGFGISNTVEAVLDDETAAYGFVATNVETVVGFGVVLLLTAEGARNAFPVSLDGYSLGDEVAVFHASAVEEGWEGRGIGSVLMWARLELARDQYDIDAAVGNAWLRPHRVDSSALFEKFGFERIETVPKFAQRSDGDRDCPDCDGTCDCSSAIYRWTPASVA
jgi:GNAT superfamily N-acetyltransferase